MGLLKISSGFGFTDIVTSFVRLVVWAAMRELKHHSFYLILFFIPYDWLSNAFEYQLNYYYFIIIHLVSDRDAPP